MNIRLHTLLLSLPIQGLLWCVLLLTLCLFGVHFTLLARLGMIYRTKQKETNKQKNDEKEKSAPTEKTPQEPIYYIVERKQRRTKSSYGEPKEIRFKQAE